MGRKKIQISRITDERNRQVTFNKRKFGVMKKAYELSVLCDCEIALIIFSSSNKLYQYASTDMDKVLLKYTEYNEPHESLTNKNIIEALSKKEHKNGACSPDSGENDSEFQLTPSTEAKYEKIDEAFQIMLQKNQMGRMDTPNYPLPLNVSTGGYSNSSLLQTSPHVGQNSVSPRPSSSEAESVYRGGSILEISNGYPNSLSPGRKGSASPGLSPAPANMQIKINESSKMSSSSTTSTRPNLRVVIPNQQDENNSSHNTTLNTPIVGLQTSAISSYANLFPDTDLSLGSMNWPSMQSHSNPVHLGVTNASPVTSSPSPNSVHIKSEPNSPPLAHILHSSHASVASQHSMPGSSLSSAASTRHEYDGGPISKRPREWGP